MTKFRELWLKEVSPPSFLKLPKSKKIKKFPCDPLTLELMEIIGHGRWRWAALAWDAFSKQELVSL